MAKTTKNIQLGGVNSERGYFILPFGSSTSKRAGNVQAKGKGAGGRTNARTQNNRHLTVYMKRAVAEALGFSPTVGIPTQQVTFDTAAGKKTVTRHSLAGSYRGKSITVIFTEAVEIAGQKFESVSVPLPSGATITDALQYFAGVKATPNAKGARAANNAKAGIRSKVLGIRTESGKTYNIPGVVRNRGKGKGKAKGS